MAQLLADVFILVLSILEHSTTRSLEEIVSCQRGQDTFISSTKTAELYVTETNIFTQIIYQKLQYATIFKHFFSRDMLHYFKHWCVDGWTLSLACC